MKARRAPRTVPFGGEVVRLAGSGVLTGRAADLAADSVAENTVKAYAGHLARLDAYCEVNGLSVWSPEVVAQYLAHRYEAGNKGVALQQCVSAVRAAYRATGRECDYREWSMVVRGAKRELARRGVRTKEAEPLRWEDLRAACKRLARVSSDTRAYAKSRRDRALLLIGWLSGLRLEELVGLRCADVVVKEAGKGRERWLEVTAITKTSAGLPQTVTIPASVVGDDDTCPVKAWEDWSALRPPSLFPGDDPAWLSVGRTGRLQTSAMGGDKSIARVIGAALAAVNVDPAPYTAHSLRAGLATELSELGVSIPQIANAGRWTGLQTVLGYARRGRRLKDSPLRRLGY